MANFTFIATQFLYFNSIKVQLEHIANLIYNQGNGHFNSIKVQLELTAGATYCTVDNTFQFHKGTIRTRWYPSLLLSLFNFNSIKVQLELVAGKGAQIDARFQFHKGTIRTIAAHFLLYNDSVFQFHKGTIRTRCA